MRLVKPISDTLCKAAASPQYVLHPSRALRRTARRPRGRREPGGVLTVPLPWGPEITVRASEGVGFNIAAGRVWDACVSEVLHRLLDSGETALDIGANYGYMTSILAHRAGSHGSVAAFEPHPALVPLLRRNAERWSADPGLARVDVHDCGLSRAPGTAMLHQPRRFAGNAGIATLEAASEDGDAFAVDVRRLDDLAPAGSIGVVKIDVEGHECAVLEGACDALGQRRIRDVVLEEHGGALAPSLALLRDNGYTIFSLGNTLLRLIVAPADRPPRTGTWLGQSYLATRDPIRAQARLRPGGWLLPGVVPWRGR